LRLCVFAWENFFNYKDGYIHFGKHSHTEIHSRTATGAAAAAGSRAHRNAANACGRSATRASVRWPNKGSR
jgi:hypothetical protein